MKTYRILKLISFSIALGLVSSVMAIAAENWQITKLASGTYPPEIVTEKRQVAENSLPDGLIATGKGQIRSAWYGSPTNRYAHGILGDDIEGGSLHVQLANGRRLNLVLPRNEVFEDRYPRIFDLDGNGSSEIVTIRSSLSKGASLTIYGVKGGKIIKKASTGFIGKKNRWLNIAGIAPFLGIRGNEIAFVKTPHIGGTLFIVRYAGGKLIQIGAGGNFSNHVIGSTEMRLSAIVDVNADGKAEIALPSADRRLLRIVGTKAGSIGGNKIVLKKSDLKQGGLNDIGVAILHSPIDKAIGVQMRGEKGCVVGLENGETYLVHR